MGIKERCSPKRIAIGAAVLLVLAAIIAPLLYFNHKSHKRTDEENNRIPEELRKALKKEKATSPKSTTAKVKTVSASSPATVQPVVILNAEDRKHRIDCMPEAQGLVVEISKQVCEERGCEYAQTESSEFSCLFKKRDEYGFSVKYLNNTVDGQKVHLTAKGRSPFMTNSKVFENPVLEVKHRGQNVLQFKLYDEGTPRYQVPMSLDLPHEVGEEQYDFQIDDKINFAFSVRRKKTGTILFDTGVGGLTLTDKFLQLATKLPSKNVYGFGENIHYSFRHEMNYRSWPMFGRDQPTSMRNQNRSNLYGTHPFYTCVEDDDGNTHGVLLLNSNAQDYSFTPLPMLTYRTIGGILDFYIFLGPTPEMVVQQYTKAIGRPFMPPYWALGFQLSRYGYNNLTNMKNAVDRMKQYNIPQDVQYADIDHMDGERDFTIDPINFKDLPEYFSMLKKGGMHTIIILDPFFISNNTNYEPYEKLKNVSGAIMWGKGYGDDANTDPTGALLGWIWPNGKSAFPDFFKNRTKLVWKELIKKHIKKINYDGLWIDMNEPASFDTNKERAWNWPKDDKPYWNLICPENEWDDPPYRTMAAFVHDNAAEGLTRLSSKTICMVAVQGDTNQMRHYDVHNLYGWSQSAPTLDAMRDATGKRSMVLSRSTFPGSGKYAGHWLGDNDSTWTDMIHSIIGMMEFSLFGIPYIGADICGFMLGTTEELCLRWMQLGAFYPFSRNHNGIGVREQDPGVFGETVANASRDALETRYWLLPYLYTLFHHAHTEGSTVVRPLHHEFPGDSFTRGIDRQFLWGGSLLISPILSKGDHVMKYYLPKGRWYNFYTSESTEGPKNDSLSVSLATPIQLHVRGGSIIPMQEPALNTTFSRKNAMTIKVFLDKYDTEGGTAEGDIFWDDGEAIDTYETGNYIWGRFYAKGNMLQYKVEGKFAVGTDVPIDTIEIMGVNTSVSSVFLEDKPMQELTTDYDVNSKILRFTNLTFPLSEPFTIHWYSADFSRIDCYPERLGGIDLVTEEKCKRRGCLYSPTNSQDPDCFFNTTGNGYRVINCKQDADGSGWSANLKRQGKSPFLDALNEIVFRVDFHGDNALRFYLDANDTSSRYKVPMELDLPTKAKPRDPRYSFKVIDHDNFQFQVIRKSSGVVLWDTSVGGLTFEDQFLQIATKLPSTNIYGFGENVHASFRHDLRWKQWPMFSRDEGTGNQGQQLLHSLGVTVSPTSIHKKRKLLVQEQSKRIEETVTSYVRKKEEEYNMYKEEAIYATSDKAHTPDEDVASSSTCTTAVKFTVQPGVLNMSQNTKYEDEKLMQLESGCSADMIENHGGKPSGMIEILQRVHQIAVPHTNSDVLERVVFGGDCLTNERAFSAQQAMQNDPSKFSSLKGVVHRPEGLHREMNFLLVFQFILMHLFLFPLSSRDLPALLQGNIIRQWHFVPAAQCDKQERRYWTRKCYTEFQNAKNHYGVHPFYTCVEDDGQTHGVLLLNSNAQDYAFTPLPMLIYRTIGGIFDFYMFFGPEPENVIQQYTTAIGKPYMPPYWSLGFQLCRYGYNHIDKMKEAVDRTAAAGIPHDVQYADIDHMDTQMDFTIDHKNYPGLNNYFKELQNGGMKTIIILDPCLITNVTGYEPYDRMKAVGGSIRWPNNYPVPQGSANDKNEMLGYVWPQGKVIFPDFFLNGTEEVWKDLIKKHHSNLSFDGLWIDMNEPANFGTNLDRPWNWPDDEKPYWSLKCNMSDKLEHPPYRPMAAFVFDKKGRLATISDKTVCMVGRQGADHKYRHYDVHSLYGWSQTKSTLDGLRLATPDRRGLVISRSTFPGSGQYTGHWLGDNSAVWDDVQLSIIGMLEFNLFGIPYIGADICGFFGDSNPELCKRWMQLGAFYTFSRNHNGINYKEQDPAVFGDEVATASREALETRYELLPYLYTLFHHAHVRGGTVIRPLHHEFPTDRFTYSIDDQFMWGKAVLISPVLYQGQTSMNLYLPRGYWYDYYTGDRVTDTGLMNMNVSVELLDTIPLHIRGGNILVTQRHARNTTFSRKNPFTMKVALEYDGRRHTSSGDLFWDDGDSIDSFESGNYYYAIFDFIDNRLKIMVQHANESSIESLHIEKIQILGSPQELEYAYINGSSQKNVQKVGNVYELKDVILPMASSFEIVFMEDKRPNDEQSMAVDCYPDKDGKVETAECFRRGCKYTYTSIHSVPQCYIDISKYGYTKTNVSKNSTLTSVHLTWKNQSQMFTGDITNIRLEIRELSENVVQLKFIDPLKTRYEVPVPLSIVQDGGQPRKYNVTYQNDINGVFFVKVSRLDTGKVIFDTSIGGFTFADQFLQLSTRLPSRNVYGLGENRHFTFRHNMDFKRWPMFSRDNGVNWGDYANLYGVHPFYMCIEDDTGNSNGVLLLNSNAMEIIMQPLPALTYRTVGGVLDFYLFMGPSPENVIQQYTELIGRPYFPPYWALGFQLSRYGYNNIEKMMDAVNRTRDAGIPHDVQYADIDHMDERKDFTIDHENFPSLKGYVEKLKTMGVHFIIILDPALLSNDTQYYPYLEGVKKDVFVKWPNNSINPDFSEYNRTDMLGFVWPKGKVVFPDFFNNNTRQYWIDLITRHHHNISFDGLWIDMNEPANFGTNEEIAFNWPVDAKPYWTLKCPQSSLDDPPYKPRGIYGPRLSDKTLCMIGQQGNGKYNHYDVHSLYGWSQSEPTLAGLRLSTGKRGIVISRSTYPSSGRYAGHWLGDNDSGWRDMHDSVIGIMEFNLFGIPYIGADICGFFGDTTPELCERWMQLGAFYTFSRNHNTLGAREQDPAIFGEAIATSSRRVLELRYSLLPYLYTLFYHAHTKGNTVIRSMAQNFPTDSATWDIDAQFMWGSEILIIPVLQAGKQDVMGYFPEGRWFDLRSGEEMQKTKQHHFVPAPRDHIPVFVKGGSMLPMQYHAVNTEESRKNPFSLLIAPSVNNSAAGNLFWDDGDSKDTIANNSYYYSEFQMKDKDISIEVKKNNTPAINGLNLSYVVVLGVTERPTNITMTNPNRRNLQFQYDQRKKVLNITDINVLLASNISITVLL